MLISYIRLALRTFVRNRIPFIINLLGMGIALGCCITAYVNFEYNSDFDKDQQNAAHIYRISFWQQQENKKVPFGVCPMPVGNLVREALKGSDRVIQYISKSGQFRIGDEMFEREFVYADPSFAEVFSIELLSGKLDLKDRSEVFISDKLAIVYFGSTDVLGKSLTQMISGQPREFSIAGVYKAFPQNSSFRFDLLTTFENYFTDPAQRSVIENDWSKWATTFLYLEDPASVAPITKQLQQYIKVQNDARRDLQVQAFYVEPFKGMAARAARQRNMSQWTAPSMPPAAVIAPFAMAGFLLLVACFNFMNNAIAVASNRLKEIGIRKVIGGKRRELVAQFLSETTVFCLLALGLGLILAEYFVDGWNGMWSGLEISIQYANNPSLLVAIVILMMATALLAGAYPAFYISAFRPIEILRGTTRFGGTNWLTKGLLVFQFSISLAAVIFALAFYFNSRYQKEFDLGYSYRSVIQVPLEGASQFDKLKNELATHPLIQSVAGSQHHIYATSYKSSARTDKGLVKEIDMLNVGDDYFKTVNVRVLAGRGFERDRASDLSESLIVNEEFARVFNLVNPIGQRIMLNDTIPVFITGVVKDVYLAALFQPLSPVAFRYVPVEDYRYLLVSTAPDELVKVSGEVKEAWKKVFPTQLYRGKLMESSMVMSLEHFDAVVILYTFLGLVAIIMSVSGLYSMVTLNLQKRTKELGIRKILGAPLVHMVVQAGRLFIIIMILSFVIGSVFGSVMVNGLMDSVWEYYVAINLKILTLAVAVLVSIALATIGFKIIRVAFSNPVDSLRHE